MQQANLHDTSAETEAKPGVKDTLGDLANHVSEYMNTFYRVQLLKLTRKATDVTANLAGGLVAAVLGVFFLFFGGMALGFWLGELFDSNALGFLVVAVFFALVALVFIAIRKKLVFPIWRNKIIRKLYE